MGGDHTRAGIWPAVGDQTVPRERNYWRSAGLSDGEPGLPL